jgi:hypothetical protein
MAGLFTPPASDSGDVILIKVDSLGNIVWSKRYGGPREERAFSVKQTSDGGYITVARTKSFVDTTRGDVLLIKTDPNGNLQWGRVYSNPSLDDEFGGAQSRSFQSYIVAGRTCSYGYDVQITSDGGFYYTGFLGGREWMLSIPLIKRPMAVS